MLAHTAYIDEGNYSISDVDTVFLEGEWEGEWFKKARI